MKTIFMAIFLSSSVFALLISAMGQGKTIEEAKKNALSNLSFNIYSEVDTTFHKKIIVLGNDFEKESGQNLKISSKLPILKPQFSSPKLKNNLYEVKASLDRKKSEKAYLSELKNLRLEIRKGWEIAKKKKGDVKEAILFEALQKFNEFQRYSVVARQLEIRNISILNLTKAQLESEMAQTLSDGTQKLINVNSKVKVEVKTDRKRNRFKIGESVKIYLRFSKKGYFYIVNHVLKENKSFSYLVELNPDFDDRNIFIQKINADEVGKWTILGEMEISPPVGKEYLEIFWKSRPFSQRDFPKYKYDLSEDSFILTGKGIIPNFKKNRKMGLKQNLSRGRFDFSTY
jgi:hypothetical protein